MDERDFRDAWERNFWATLPAGRPLGPFLNSARINRRRPISRWLLCSPIRHLRSVLSCAQGGNLLLANTGRSTSPQAAGAVWKLVRCWSSESDSCRQNRGINNVEKYKCAGPFLTWWRTQFSVYGKKGTWKKVQLQCVSGAHSGSDSQSSVFFYSSSNYTSLNLARAICLSCTAQMYSNRRGNGAEAPYCWWAVENINLQRRAI